MAVIAFNIKIEIPISFSRSKKTKRLEESVGRAVSHQIKKGPRGRLVKEGFELFAPFFFRKKTEKVFLFIGLQCKFFLIRLGLLLERKEGIDFF